MTSAVGHDHDEPADVGDPSRKLVRQLAAAAGTRFALFGAVDHERQVVDAIAVWDGDCDFWKSFDTSSRGHPAPTS